MTSLLGESTITVIPMPAVEPSSIAVAEMEGWSTALYRHALAEAAAGRAPIEDERAADWQYLLPLEATWQVLVMGCGWGTIPIALARNVGHVVAMDRDAERIHYLDVRRRQQALGNVEARLAGTIGEAGVAKGSLHLVSVREFPQREGRVAAFGEVARDVYELLRPGGFVQFSLANRLTPMCLMRGDRERMGQPVHSLGGYRRLLRQAGFSEIEVYLPLPHHDKVPMFYVPWDDVQALQFFLRSLFPLFERVAPNVRQSYARQYALAQLGVQAAVRMRLARIARHVMPGFCIFARKGLDDQGSHVA
ncbi:MAG: hypothetical protein NVS2B7_34940 [Herpetosiphon sp.]